MNRDWHAPSRRKMLLAGFAGMAATAAGISLVEASPEQVAEEVKKVTGGKAASDGKIKLDLPSIAENGLVVPLNFEIESPMTEKDYVKAIHVLTEKNPQPNVVSVHLGPRAGRASITTRVRLADTQTVTAIAQLSDGSLWVDRVPVVVTLSACLEDGLI